LQILDGGHKVIQKNRLWAAAQAGSTSVFASPQRPLRLVCTIKVNAEALFLTLFIPP
jgi:hypothetical protein